MDESPSARREWIEMVCPSPVNVSVTSPSARREWIEMACKTRLHRRLRVSLREEGVV